MRILVTGAAGFIGFHLARRLLRAGHEVVGVDAFTAYYDPALKERRHAQLAAAENYRGFRVQLEDFEALKTVYGSGFDVVFHLAAQAGVRYSLEAPRAYIEANVNGTFNLLELMRAMPPRHALLASTSSVYGAAPTVPFHESAAADHPLSLYAATKKATEAMAHSYSHLFAIPTTMLRFFTVYGPWGRPDMALFKFTQAVLRGEPIDVYNHGKLRRDFTFVDDLVEAMAQLIAHAPAPGQRVGEFDSLSGDAAWRVVNIGAGQPVELMDFIKAIEQATGRAAICNYLPFQPGDVPDTFANTDLLSALTGYRPATPLSKGVPLFVDWYRGYFGL